MTMQTLQIQRMGMIDDQSLRIRSPPLTDSQLGMIALIGHTSHKDGILLCTKFMGQHLSKVIGYLYGVEMIVDKTIGCLGPFQDDIRALFTMECEETTVQIHTFLLKHTHFHLDSSFPYLADTTALDLCKRIHTAYHHAAYTFFNDQVSTGGVLP